MAGQREAEARINRGFVACFPWFTRERVARGCSPARLMKSAASLVSVAAAYPTDLDLEEASPGSAPRGRVSRYALVDDYHRVMAERLTLLERYLRREVRGALETRTYVDTGPLLERAVGQRAGIGWFGKNSNLLVPGRGSWVFLGELITSLELEPDAALRKACGKCQACIAACPTEALLAPYTLDARRCISYLTIELRGWIPRELRPLVGQWVFGCDVCQEVCPVNSRARSASPVLFKRLPALSASPSLVSMVELSDREYQARFRCSALNRAKRQGLRRNAAVALGNSGDRSVVPRLARVLLEDEDDVVRGHAAWALGHIGGLQARKALLNARRSETTHEVKVEIESALQVA